MYQHRNGTRKFSGTLNQLFGKTQLISFRGLYTDRTIQNQGIGGYTLPEAGAQFEDREDLFHFNHRGLITPKLLNRCSEDSTPPQRA
jgi:hypothetical protein